LALGIVKADPATIKNIGGGAAKPYGNIGVIGPGTGLGVASLVWDNKGHRYIPVPCEGGHVTMPSTHAREFALFSWLLEHKYSHISAERVCSGKGLINLYDAIRGVDGLDLPDRRPEQITKAALDGSCAACREALTLMMAFLGRVAGNLALTCNTTGGVYLTGGILPSLGVPYIEASRLRGDFIAKGRKTAELDRIPIFLAEDPHLALKGLALHALES
jgi:glucokinase